MRVFDERKLSLLGELLTGCGSALLVSHHGPDGDATGCVVALKHFLEDTLSRKATILLPSEPPSFLNFLTSGEGILYPDSPETEAALAGCDLLVCLDLNALNRTDSLQGKLSGLQAKKVLIDHHLNPADQEFDLVFSSPDVSSACEMLFEILMKLPQTGGDASRLSPRTAEALMTGMTTDTNNFANSVFPGTLAMASALLGAGVDREAIIDHLYKEYRPNRIALCSHMLSNELHFIPGGGACMVVTRQIWDRFEAMDGETEGLVNTPLSINEVRLSILAREDNGFFRISVRSKRGTSANGLAALHFHGGGHVQAAGGRILIPEDIEKPEQALEYIMKVTARFLQDNPPFNE